MLFRSRWMLAMNASRAASMVDTRAIGVKDLNDDGDDHDDAKRAARRIVVSAESTSTDARATRGFIRSARDRVAAVVFESVVKVVRALLSRPSRAREMEEEVGSATTRADEASAAASSPDEADAFADANPAAPLSARTRAVPRSRSPARTIRAWTTTSGSPARSPPRTPRVSSPILTPSPRV